ncbi:MAG TPA: hypothetical protein DDY82_01730 [Clostridiales bacterium]|nr:hypothetical protein [Clostridiales bacterium]
MLLLKMCFFVSSVVFPVAFIVNFKNYANFKEYFSLCFCLNFTTLLLFFNKSLSSMMFLVVLFIWNLIFLIVEFFIDCKKPKKIEINNEMLKNNVTETVYYCSDSERQTLNEFYLFLNLVSDEVPKEKSEEYKTYNDFLTLTRIKYGLIYI